MLWQVIAPHVSRSRSALLLRFMGGFDGFCALSQHFFLVHRCSSMFWFSVQDGIPLYRVGCNRLCSFISIPVL